MYGPEDQEDVKRVTVQPSDKRLEIQPQSVQPDLMPLPAEIVRPVQASSSGTTSFNPTSSRIPVSPMPQRASPNPPASPMSPVNPRRVSFGPAPALIAPIQPVAVSPAPVPKSSTPAKDYGRGRRGQIPNRQLGFYQANSVSLNNVYSVDLNPQTMDDVKWLHVNNLVSDYDQSKNLFVMMGAHDDYWDRVAMQITLELALKTQFKAQVEASAVVECTKILNFKMFKYLRDKSQRGRPYTPRYSLVAW